MGEATRTARTLRRQLRARLGSRRSRRPLAGTRILVTGGNTGIGLALAREALGRGATVHVTCRSREKVSATLDTLCSEYPNVDLGGWVLDLSSMESVNHLCTTLRHRGIGIDMLILNAGVHVPFGRRITADGEELHEQVNFLAPAYLFRSLEEHGVLSRGAAYISSDAHHRGWIPTLFPVSFWARYARSKLLATTYFQAARPLFPERTISILSPGNVESDVHRHKSRWVRALRRRASPGRAPAVAAREILDALFVSADPERYRNRGRPDRTAPQCSDPDRILSAWHAVERFREAHDPDPRPGGAGRPIEVVQNHAGTLIHLGPAAVRPRTAEEVSDLVRAARRVGGTVRVVGSKHSYNDCFYAHTTSISLDHFDAIGEIDRERNTVTVGAGVTVQALSDELDARGYTLRWSGNSGSQTFVGAALTGTHGYCRAGGLLAELIVGARVVTGTGEVRELTSERDLRAVRVSVGALCLVLEVTVEIQPKGRFVEYALDTLDEDDFLEALPRLARENEYFRFFPNRFHPERISVLTINPTRLRPSKSDADRIRFIDDLTPPRALVAALRIGLRSRLMRTVLRRLPAPKLQMSIVAPYTSLMFVNAGITRRWPTLVGLVYQAWNDDETRNLELAIRAEDFESFVTVYRDVEWSFRERGRGQDCYFTGRFVGGSTRTLLGPNHERDVVFVDVHATKSPGAADFLTELERRVSAAVPTRPHWGKEFRTGAAALRAAYPPSAWAAFEDAKRRLDPDNVFSNAYTRRVFGW